MSQMLKSSGAMGAATLASRIFGMLREMVYARFMGDGSVASAFVMAFTIPNLFRRLLGEGALTAAFIPIFKAKEKTTGEAEMWRSANAVISGLLVAATAITGLVLLCITLVLMTGLVGAKIHLMLQLLRVMFPYMLLACLSAIFIGMLNSRGQFFIPALGTTVLNLIMIASVLWLTPHFGATLTTQIFGLACGVLIAGVAQVVFQWPHLHREGFRYSWVTPWGNETVQEVLRKMLPGTVGVAAFQLNVLLTQTIAYGVDESIVASFNYAVRLMELPQGVFGISLATFLLPTLSGLAAEKKYTDFVSTLKQGLGYLCFINLLTSVLLMVLATPIIRLIFERGEFDESSTARAASALACLAPGLVAFSVVNIMARAFYALGDTTTPMKISVVCLVLNLICMVPLVLSFKQAGLGLANTLSSLVNVGLLCYALRLKLKHMDWGAMPKSIIYMASAAMFAGALAWTTHRLWEHQVGYNSLGRKIGEVFVPMGSATLAYWIIMLAVRIPEAREILEMLRNKTGRR